MTSSAGEVTQYIDRLIPSVSDSNSNGQQPRRDDRGDIPTTTKYRPAEDVNKQSNGTTVKSGNEGNFNFEFLVYYVLQGPSNHSRTVG